ncbi:protein-tyrosine phosphatase-like protein [Schizothecium vesticola]|uniref:protein-tyrosine-phosphatase n=1 Tax=Schizothecium vesticola TaxID=314040 RepID=A0AA40EPF7_9PEZI|nr:protein-tyrosine phosphatase-like protein [Schizothecium vesticola]
MGKKKQPTSSSKSKQPAACILTDLLYLGPVSATSNTAFLERQAITHILSIGKSPASRVEGITYQRLSLTDEEDSPIAGIVEKACDIIDAAEAAKGRVLIHCSAAISRSPTIVTGYLMKRRGTTLRESLTILVNARAVASPNPGFLRQLSEMEKELFQGESSFDPSRVTSNTRLSAYLAH